MFHFAVGEETLCGEIGLLALLSKEPALRSSGDALLSILELVLSMSPRGTESPVPVPPAADVSMVIVGALGRRGAESGVLLSAIMMPNVSLGLWWGRLR